jgi:hypothetical protein
MSAATKAANRRASYERRVAGAVGERQRLFAVVGWLMAEWRRLPVGERTAGSDPLLALARDLNERNGRDPG